MPQFAYRARNAQGGLVEGVLDCADRAVAIRQIELQQYIPIRIDIVGAEPKISSRDAAAPAPARQSLKIPHGQLLVFTEQLAHLLQAGMTLDEGLSILEKRLKQPRVQQMTHALHQALIDGRSFSQALSEFPRMLPPLYTNMVAAGEASGALPQILVRLVKHLMQAKDLRDRVQQALIYPAFLALAGAILITVFITFMVPQLTGFMSETGGTLPLPTRILVHLHHAIRSEASGALPQILARLVKHLMQAKDLRDRVQQALIYPAFLALAGAILITVFITFMVPQLTGFMSETGGTLPLPTRILVHLHHAI